MTYWNFHFTIILFLAEFCSYVQLAVVQFYSHTVHAEHKAIKIIFNFERHICTGPGIHISAHIWSVLKSFGARPQYPLVISKMLLINAFIAFMVLLLLSIAYWNGHSLSFTLCVF